MRSFHERTVPGPQAASAELGDVPTFDRGAVHYVVLDDVHWHGDGYLGYLDHDQLTYLENDPRLVEAGRRVLVALHIPVLGTSHIRPDLDEPVLRRAGTNRDRLYELLDPYRAHIGLEATPTRTGTAFRGPCTST